MNLQQREFYKIIPPEEIMLQLPGIVMWKDANLIYRGANTHMISMFGFKSLDHLVGSTVYDIPCPCVACADDFKAQDLEVITNKANICTLNIHPFVDNTIKMLIGNRKVILNAQGVAIGTIYCGIETNQSLLLNFGTNLSRQDQKYNARNQIQRSYRIAKTDNRSLLSEREMQCVFYIARGKSAKHIAKLVNLSHRTIEKHIENAKRKLGCHTKSQFIEKVTQEGLLNIIPTSIFKNHSFSCNAFESMLSP